MHRKVSLLLACSNSLKLTGSHDRLLTCQEYLLCACLNALLKEKQLILDVKLGTHVVPLYPNEPLNPKEQEMQKKAAQKKE